ncbi:MAG: CoA-binding protein [Dehalococcoidia bacterium]|nr:CoA-binding protein [Dehalococcoidia bacterium]
MRKPDFETMFHPKSVAVIGASPNSNKMRANFVASYQTYGFKGNIYPIHPTASEIRGLKAYPNIASVPEKVDLVIVSVPARLVPQILNECADVGANNIHIFTAGFKESEENEGADLERRIKEIAGARGLAIIGPNGMGLHVPESGLTPWAKTSKECGTVGVIAQSGSVGGLISQCAMGAGFRFSKIISYGNGTVLDSTDFLEYLKDDPKTEIIAMYLEGIGDGRRLTQLVKEISPRKPVIILNGGVTDSGARAIASHTGSLASSAAAWGAFFKQTGAVRADTLEELIDIIMAFYFMTPMPGNRVAVLGTGGGPAVTCTDALCREGLQVPALTEETQSRLRELILDAGTSIKNPLDANAAYRDPAVFERTLNLLIGDPVIDALLIDFTMTIVLGANRPGGFRFNYDADKFREFARGNAYGKPLAVILGTFGYYDHLEHYRMALQKLLSEAGIAVFPSLGRAARALAQYARYWDYRRQLA